MAGYPLRVRLRWISLVAALALVGGAAGYLVGTTRDLEPTTFAAAVPVPASDPSVPVAPTPGFTADIDYPALRPGLEYVAREIGSGDYRWAYAVPVGWIAQDRGNSELWWRPADEPAMGGYSVRVKLINEHLPALAMVDQKEATVEALYQDVDILERGDDMISFSYRDPFTSRQRFNTFTWFTAPRAATAEFEMSVVGREVDRLGLEDLRRQVAASITKLD